ncbi:unnamed protein product [Clonostachys byssicola]|uniref:Uncharacterized protein n=1 Tax=Clonostachys byssicola TaxID=160290 RepID=A0A9N9UHZ6_9HYPO|nr:unnamed protein product [Clonostachys byssicola]
MSRPSQDRSSSTPDEDESAQSPAGTDHEKMMALLSTPWHAVYQLSEDGSTYLRPSFLRGVPVQKINESSDYWDGNWTSLDAYIAREEEEERLKAEFKARKDINPSKAHLVGHKLHSDNVSKQRKIREMFGGNAIPHPNQLVSKHHLPYEGLCEQELMYKIGCKLSDLEFLKSRQKLTMEPWDFFRWRVGVTMEKKILIPGRSGRDHIKSVVQRISSENSDDPLFRKAVEYSAGLQNHKGRYGPKKKPARPYKIMGKIQKGTTPQGYRPTAPRASVSVGRARPSAKDVLRERQERRARLQEQYQSQSTYQGVNERRRQKALNQSANAAPE